MSSRTRGGDASSPARHSEAGGLVVDDIRDPGDAFIQAEIDSNRRYEWTLVPKAFISLAVVLVLVVVRQLFFV